MMRNYRVLKKIKINQYAHHHFKDNSQFRANNDFISNILSSCQEQCHRFKALKVSVVINQLTSDTPVSLLLTIVYCWKPKNHSDIYRSLNGQLQCCGASLKDRDNDTRQRVFACLSPHVSVLKGFINYILCYELPKLFPLRVKEYKPFLNKQTQKLLSNNTIVFLLNGKQLDFTL